MEIPLPRKILIAFMVACFFHALSAFPAEAQASQNNSTCVNYTIPAVMSPGEQKTVSVTVRNTGATTWTTSGPNYYYIAVAPGSSQAFGVPYVALPSPSIAPGSTATFSFTITAPQAQGVYVLQYQMAQQGVEYFGEWCGHPFVRIAYANDSKFFRVSGNKLYLNNSEFIVKGTNYLGGIYFDPIMVNGLGYGDNWFRKFDDKYWNETEIEKELQFLKNNLGINTIRVFLPDDKSIESLITWHNFPPWFLDDGSINPMYLKNIKGLLDIAKRNNLKVLITLFQNKAVYIKDDPAPPGSQNESFYFRHLESLIPELRNRTEIIAYEIVNEPMPASVDNFWQQGVTDQQMASFIVRMTRKVAELDSNHLITLSHVAFYKVSSGERPWWSPLAAMSGINDIDNLNGGAPIKLIDYADFIAPHYYYGISFISYEDGRSLIEDLKNKTSKPIVFGEFGEKRTDPEQQREVYYQATEDVKNYSLSGMINWGDFPYANITFCPTCYNPNDWPVFDDSMNPLPAATVYRENFVGTSWHKSDTDCDGHVNTQELNAFLYKWKLNSSDVTLKELIEAIGLWRRG